MKRLVPLLVACAALLLLDGCASLGSLPAVFRPPTPRPGRTSLGSQLVIIPALSLGNYLVVEAKLDRHGPYRFLVDTGSSVTLVTPAFASRFASQDAPPSAAPPVRVQSADGRLTQLSPTLLHRLEFGDARFDDVFALVYDCAALSAHLGVRIDGILGFPLFRETILTLDYPQSRILLQPRGTAHPPPGQTIPLHDASKTPLINVRLGDRTLAVLIDSGSDAPLSLNPIGLHPAFAVAPRAGTTVGTLTGDRPQQLARLADALLLGDYTLPRPVVDLTDELSAIGGGILKNFTVTFDQERDRVTFFRDSSAPLLSPPRRSLGLSFTKTPAYWRVAGVLPASSASDREIARGDLLTHLNGEPVTQWDLNRYERLIASADEVALTFLTGSQATQKIVRILTLVP